MAVVFAPDLRRSCGPRYDAETEELFRVPLGALEALLVTGFGAVEAYEPWDGEPSRVAASHRRARRARR